MKVDIVMLTLTNTPELYKMTCDALDSLKKSEKDIEFEVTIVESNIRWNSTDYPFPQPVTSVVIPEQTFNYNKFCKIGLKYCKNEWVALCNNDLIFHEGWMSEIIKVHDTMMGYIQSFTPWNPYQEWHDKLMRPGVNDYKVYEGYRTSYEVGGWCLVTKKELLNRINLDDRVNFWYSDNVYIDEMRKIGVKHGLVRNSKVSHICSVTSKNVDPNILRQMTYGQENLYLEGR